MPRTPMSVEQRRVQRIRSLILRIVLYFVGLGLSILLGYLAIRYLGNEVVVIDQSMAPGLENEDVVLLNKLSYMIHSPRRNDVVVLSFGTSDNSPVYLRRIIGLPEETVRIEDGHIYVDDEELDIKFNEDAITDGGVAEEGITLEEDEYFVICDNYNEYTDDSRLDSIGTVTEDQIKGEAWLVWSPLSRLGLIR